MIKQWIVVLLFAVTSTNAIAAQIEVFDCLIEPAQMVEIASPVSGMLDRVYAGRGDIVKRGQKLAHLESSVEAAALELAHFKSEATAALDSAHSKVDYTQQKFKRHQDMQTLNFMSVQERDDAENEMKLAEGELKQAQESKAQAFLEWKHQKALLAQRTVYSPFNGVVARQMAYPGEVIEPSGDKKVIMTLAQLDPLKVYVILPAEKFSYVGKGMTVTVKPEMASETDYQAQVRVVDRLIDAGSATFGVFLELENPGMKIPSGIHCQASFDFKNN